jgi:hypothetical protein
MESYDSQVNSIRQIYETSLDPVLMLDSNSSRQVLQVTSPVRIDILKIQRRVAILIARGATFHQLKEWTGLLNQKG